jgi:hypothetical protein
MQPVRTPGLLASLAQSKLPNSKRCVHVAQIAYGLDGATVVAAFGPDATVAARIGDSVESPMEFRRKGWFGSVEAAESKWMK